MDALFQQKTRLLAFRINRFRPARTNEPVVKIIVSSSLHACSEQFSDNFFFLQIRDIKCFNGEAHKIKCHGSKKGNG